MAALMVAAMLVLCLGGVLARTRLSSRDRGRLDEASEGYFDQQPKVRMLEEFDFNKEPRSRGGWMVGEAGSGKKASFESSNSIKMRLGDSECLEPPASHGLSWGGPSCTGQKNSYQVGATCLANCSSEHLMGPHYLTCEADGKWKPHIPMVENAECWSVEQIAKTLRNKLKHALSQPGQWELLFMMQESATMAEEDFKLAKRFLKSVAFSFPLSGQRAGSVIAFSRFPRLQQVDEESTCYFHRSLSTMHAEGAGVKYLPALRAAERLLAGRDKSQHALIIFVVHGNHEGEDTWLPVAEGLKSAGHQIVVLGVGDVDVDNLQKMSSLGYDSTRNFVQFPDFDTLEEVSKYMRIHFKKISFSDCPDMFNFNS